MNSILDQGLLARDIPLKRWPDHVKLQEEVLSIFDNALKTIKPIEDHIAEASYELFNNFRPWTCYNHFDFKRYFKAADNKFYQLKKKLEKKNIKLILEYNMTFHDMWVSFVVNLNDPGKEDDDLEWFDSELELDGLFYKEILDRIFEQLNLYPIILNCCFNELGETIEMKAWSLNWDT